MADLGGRLAARLRMSANDRVLNQSKVSRLANGWNSRCISSNQNFSSGELPITTATLFVSGSSRSMLERIPEKSTLSRTTASLAVRLALSSRRCSIAIIIGTDAKRRDRFRWAKEGRSPEGGDQCDVVEKGQAAGLERPHGTANGRRASTCTQQCHCGAISRQTIARNPGQATPGRTRRDVKS